MLGAIIGDIIGSRFEVLEAKKLQTYKDRLKILNKEVPLITEESSYTDDTVLTLAVAHAIKNEIPYEKALKEYGLKELELGKDKYGRNRFGSNFVKWLNGSFQGNSIGNGAAMRISPVGFLFDSYLEVVNNAYKATIPSHNSREAINASLAISTSIYYLRNGSSKDKIKKYIEENYYNLDFNLEYLQRNYTFKATCNESVPEAIYCFLISENFEDAILKALSIGGDSDTICAIVGALSESFYGIDENLLKQVKPFIPENYQKQINEIYNDKKLIHKIP